VAAEIIPELVEEVQKAIKQVRELTEELSPVHLEKMDLAEAIRSHASKLGTRVNADILINTDRMAYAFLKSRIKEHCFLIFQEALTNALKHSGAERIIIGLDIVDDGWLVMRISDDGCGFSSEQSTFQGKGLGLSIIKERVMRLGGMIEICSDPGKGTTVTVKVPIL
jgi:signal transduction histidine kinase